MYTISTFMEKFAANADLHALGQLYAKLKACNLIRAEKITMYMYTLAH